jgi:hypothetical protein
MSEPTTTSEISNYRDMLQTEFEQVASNSFALCLAALRKVDFYKIVLARVERGVSIEDEVPEALGVSPKALKQVVLDLKTRAAVASKLAWELAEVYSGCFASSIRQSLPDREILPQFDVQHTARVAAGEVQVKIQTFRRNIEVEITGSDLAVQQLWFAMSEAALFAK